MNVCWPNGELEEIVSFEFLDRLCSSKKQDEIEGSQVNDILSKPPILGR